MLLPGTRDRQCAQAALPAPKVGVWGGPGQRHSAVAGPVKVRVPGIYLRAALDASIAVQVVYFTGLSSPGGARPGLPQRLRLSW